MDAGIVAVHIVYGSLPANIYAPQNIDTEAVVVKVTENGSIANTVIVTLQNTSGGPVAKSDSKLKFMKSIVYVMAHIAGKKGSALSNNKHRSWSYTGLCNCRRIHHIHRVHCSKNF